MAIRTKALAAAALLAALASPAFAQTGSPAPEKSEWSFIVTPYAWFMGINGSVTVKGLTANVNANFIDIVGKTDQIFALMGIAEARKREFSAYLDVDYMYLSGSGGTSLQRTPFPRTSLSVNANVNLAVRLLIAEAGLGYELLRSGPVSNNGEANSGGGWLFGLPCRQIVSVSPSSLTMPANLAPGKMMTAGFFAASSV